MYQPRQQNGRIASIFMPSWANEGRNIPTPGLSFYPILPISMEREIKIAGDRRRASEKKVAEYKKRGNRRFVGGMSKGTWIKNREKDPPHYPYYIDDDELDDFGEEIRQERVRRIQENEYDEDEFIQDYKEKLRALELNRKYRSGTDKYFPEGVPQLPTVERAKTPKAFFTSMGLLEEWKNPVIKSSKYTDDVFGKKGALTQVRNGSKIDLLSDSVWLKRSRPSTKRPRDVSDDAINEAQEIYDRQAKEIRDEQEN